jgi:CRP/FNR family transcriptional regulator, anaerobic regulatory protein
MSMEMNAASTSPGGTLADGCAAYRGDDPCLPCALVASGDVPGLPLLPRRRVRRGQALYREGDPCRSVQVVRSGTFKSVIERPDAREQVAGFHLAGDVLGLDGLADGRHASGAVALEDSEVVVLAHAGCSFDDRADLQQVLPRLMGRELVRKQKLAVLLSCTSAEQRLASFLLNLSRRMQARGYAAGEFHLRMTRSEIGSYLGLNLETVSRTISALQQRGLLRVCGRHIQLLDRAALLGAFYAPWGERRGSPTGDLLHA